jgi:replicative DNA helicase
MMSIESQELWVEEALVSWMFLEPHAAIEHGFEADHFLDGRCRSAVKAMRSLADAGVREPVDQFIVADRMGGLNDLAMGWLTERFTAAGLDRANWRWWALRFREVRASRIRKNAAGVLLRTLGGCQSEEERDEAVVGFQKDLAELPGVVEDEPMTLHDVLVEAMSSLGRRVDARARGEHSNLGIPTGVEWLDKKFGGGWPRGCVSIIAGRTSHGKSTVAQIAALAALASGVGVHFFCLEDGAEVFGARILAQACGLPVAKFFAGECPNLRQITGQISAEAGRMGLRRFLFDTKRRPLDQIIARVDRLRAANRTAVVFIDYLSLIPLPGEGERHHEVEQVVTKLQEAAIEQGVAYVVLHQLNRSYSGRQNKQPMLSDLRDSGAIEERAAVVVFAHRPNVDDGATDEEGTADSPTVDDMDLILAKNKFGPRNCLKKLRVNFSRYRIEEESW